MIPIIVFVLAQGMWVETTQEDFADGVYEKNIYASHLDGGAIEFAPRFDLNNDGYIDLFTADVSGPWVHIYWGSDNGYSSECYSVYPTTGAANCDAADLNNDGYSDLLVAHRLTPKISIYWGTSAGPNPSLVQDFPTIHVGSQALYVADLNKDGYLDIVTSLQYIPNHGAVFWGSDSGYNEFHRTDLPVLFGVHNIEIADFNRDCWLDILFVEYQDQYNTIYWGNESGFHPAHSMVLAGPGSHGSSVADLNRDGYLDLIFSAWQGEDTYIYWGKEHGYSPTNVQILHPGTSWGGSDIIDFNADGFLDIMIHTTVWQKIYWGSKDGYSNADTSFIGYPILCTGGLIADMNNDNYLDVFCNRYGLTSPVYWGPTYTTATWLRANQDHHAMFREIGNVYNREYYDNYLSSVFNAEDTVFWWTSEWDDSLPPGSDIIMYIRSGDVAIPDTSWNDWVLIDNGGMIPDSYRAQYIQYRALFTYTTPAYFPYLFETRITYDTLSSIIENSRSICHNHVRISPNPFTLKTKISYTITASIDDVDIRLFDVTGRCVKILVDGRHEPGNYTIEWSGNDDHNQALPQGIYYLIYKSGDGSKDLTTLKIVHIKK